MKLKSTAEDKASRMADRLVPYTLGGTALTYLLTRPGMWQSGPWLAYLISNAASLAICGIYAYSHIKKLSTEAI